MVNDRHGVSAGLSMLDAVRIRPLADDLFMVAHDGLGRPRWAPRAVALGLAGGLICELVLAGRLLASQGRLRVLPGGPPADEVAHLALALVESEPQHRDLRTWLAVLMQRSVDDVAGRLTRAHLVAPNTGRVRPGGARYLPTDRTAAAWPLSRLSQFLSLRREFSWQDVALIALCKATGGLGEIVRDVPASGREYLDQLLVALLRDLPAVTEVVAYTEAAVGDAVLAHRK